MPNPINVAFDCEFKLDTPIDVKKRRHTGICICGTKGSCSYDSFCKKNFCRNKDCKYYQPQKRLDNDEMTMIIEEKECQLISLKGKGVKAVVEFICQCGFRQTSSWLHFYREKFCRHFECDYYHNNKELSTDLVKDWITFEKYQLPPKFIYKSSHGSYSKQKYNLICPNGHEFNASIEMWVKKSRCKICKGDGRTLSMEEIKKYYEDQGCKLIYSEEDFKGDVTTNIVAYICPSGHEITNMTKNNFNSRINAGIGPCAICREAGRDRVQENVKRIKTVLAKYGTKNVIQVPSIYKKQQKSSYSLKLYTFPSGKQIDLQGFESRCMDLLLQTYKEEQILSDIEDMPKILYINPLKNTQSRYYPDMYIPDKNIVIEVKSTWTLSLEYERNIAKFRATSKAGYQLHLYVFDDKEHLYTHIYNPSGTITYVPANPAKLVFID